MSFQACNRKLDFAQFCGCIDMNGILSTHMYVLGRNILSQSSCSLCSYVCIGLPRPAHPPKVKYSLLVYKQAIRQNISLCEGVLVLEGKYIHTSRENKSFETEYFCPIHTYKQRERNRWILCYLIDQEYCGRSSLQKIRAALRFLHKNH